nr:hypothetical protein [Thermodesulfitimonas autotrophica]
MAGGFEILRRWNPNGAFERLDSPFDGENPGGILLDHKPDARPGTEVQKFPNLGR